MEHFISCDWGTSNFRLRLVEVPATRVIKEISSRQGIAAVYASWKNGGPADRMDFYAAVLLEGVATLEQQVGSSLSGLSIVISGMASATIGMINLPYRSVPYTIIGNELQVQVLTATVTCPHKLIIISGVRTGDDVMRGEETMLTGCEIKSFEGEQLFIFPGTHSKHVMVENGIVKQFNTYMTGEVFELLSNKSVLAASVAANHALIEEAFIKGVDACLEGGILNTIFHVRTNQLFEQLSKEENYHYLSGLLIGEELKAIAAQKYSSVTLVANEAMTALYCKALMRLNLHEKLGLQNADTALVKGQALVFTNHQ